MKREQGPKRFRSPQVLADPDVMPEQVILTAPQRFQAPHGSDGVGDPAMSNVSLPGA